ncbi:MAG: Cys-tRNA(Pro) deacylase [Candidatus Aphodomorpha sp.]
MAKHTDKMRGGDAAAEQKTNVMRLLDQAKIPYRPYCYAHTDAVSGPDVAAALGLDPARVYKTLVTVGRTGAHYVFVLPVCRELDLKKAARAVQEKSIEMIKARELLPLTGYIHGGCSPIGMKKRLVTVVDESAAGWETIVLSAGRIGYQVELEPHALQRFVPLSFADLAEAPVEE